MGDPTKKNTIISGEAKVTGTRTGQADSQLPSVSVPAMESQTQIIHIADITKPTKLTLDGLMESWKFSPELKAQCQTMCRSYLPNPQDAARCLDFMNELAENDSLKAYFSEVAPHLPAVFSLPVRERETILSALKENIGAGDFSSAYQCALETHAAVVRVRMDAGLAGTFEEGYFIGRELIAALNRNNEELTKLVGAAKTKINELVTASAEEAVKEAKKASAPSRSGRWKLAAALGALGVSLAAGGVLYFSEARQNEELTQLLERLDIGTQKCIKANDSLVQEGKGLMNKVKFYKKQSCAEYTE